MKQIELDSEGRTCIVSERSAFLASSLEKALIRSLSSVDKSADAPLLEVAILLCYVFVASREIEQVAQINRILT